MKTLGRDEVPIDYQEMLQREAHHQHIIVEDNGVIRWQASPTVEALLGSISLNRLCPLLEVLGYGKNSEVYRKLYRDMGYSLCGYWEVFYWEVNNEECDEYRQYNLNRVYGDLLDVLVPAIHHDDTQFRNWTPPTSSDALLGIQKPQTASAMMEQMPGGVPRYRTDVIFRARVTAIASALMGKMQEYLK
jgi:hypothetical protein